MFRFADPQALYFLTAIPLLAAIYLYTGHISRKRVHRFGDARLLRSLIPGYSRRWPVVKFILMELALLLIVLMLARPQWGLQSQTDKNEGIEVALMVDVSNSMYAKDGTQGGTNRMERSQLLLSTLIDNLKNDKISLGVFAGEAYPQLPITNDHVSAKMFVNSLEPGMVTCQGTNFAAAIELGMNSFTDQKAVGKALVLVTDGEDHEENALKAAEMAAEQGIKIFVLGVGSTQGSPVPLPEGGVLLDETGKPVVTALDEASCQSVAQAAGGAYFHVDATNHALELLMAELDKLPKASTTSNYVEADEQFQAVAILAILVLLVEFFLFETRHPVFRNRQRVPQRK